MKGGGKSVRNLETSRILLRATEEEDFQLLWEWRNQPRFLNFCSVRRTLVGFNEFVGELRYDLEHDRHAQLIIELKSEQKPIGTIYSYNLNLVDGHVFVTVYLDEEYENKGYGAEAMIVFLAYLFESYPLHKIYMEVYDYNQKSWSNLEKGHFVSEGIFKEHRYFEGKRWDLRRYAIFQDRLEEIKTFLSKLQRHVKEGGGKCA